MTPIDNSALPRVGFRLTAPAAAPIRANTAQVGENGIVQLALSAAEFWLLPPTEQHQAAADSLNAQLNAMIPSQAIVLARRDTHAWHSIPAQADAIARICSADIRPLLSDDPDYRRDIMQTKACDIPCIIWHERGHAFHLFVDSGYSLWFWNALNAA